MIKHGLLKKVIKTFSALVINRANQWTGFYMITASVMKELMIKNALR